MRAPLTTPSDGCGLKLASGWVLYMVIGIWDDCAMHKRPRRVVYTTEGEHRHLPLVEGPSRAAGACLGARIAAAAAGLLLLVLLGVAIRLRHSCFDAVGCGFATSREVSETLQPEFPRQARTLTAEFKFK